MTVTREMLAAKFEVIFPHLDERQRRLLMGAEARALGHAGSGWWPGRPGSGRRRWRWAWMSWTRGLSRWAGRGGRAGDASGRPTSIRGCARRCWPWSSHRSGRPDVAAAVDDEVHPEAGGRADSPGHKSQRTPSAICCGRGFSCRQRQGRRGKAARTGRAVPLHQRQVRETRRPGPRVSVTPRRRNSSASSKTAAGVAAERRASPVSTHDFPDRSWQSDPVRVYDLAATPLVNVGTDHDTAASPWSPSAAGGRQPEQRLSPGPAAADHRDAAAPTATAPARGRPNSPPWPPRPAGDHRVPLRRHLQVEQNRAPAVLRHHHELAWQAPDQPQSHREQHRRDHHPHELNRRAELNPAATQPDQISKAQIAASRWPGTASTATGTTPSIPAPHSPRPPPAPPSPAGCRSSPRPRHAVASGTDEQSAGTWTI